MDKYLRRPTAELVIQSARYEPYNLLENPFPATPFVNPESNDARSNGEIYEPSIREAEYEVIKHNFLEIPQNDPNHLRLGYMIDSSYIGRGNGKSAFLINLQKSINEDFGLSVSHEVNKCFAITLVPEAGGKTKTFESFVDLFANGIFRSNIISDTLTALRLQAILELYSDFNTEKHFPNDKDALEKLNSAQWYSDNSINFRRVTQQILTSPYLSNLPRDFPLHLASVGLFQEALSPDQNAFIEYYQLLKRGKPRLEFVFSHLVDLFLASGFNGSYIFVDDFERIPDFQSERQKRDFALELRSCLFDGVYTNARVGFYNMILVLHAGVPRLIQTAWDQSGLEQRSPISFKGVAKHIIGFGKLTLNHAFSLVQKYLDAYRIDRTNDDELKPFTREAVAKIAETSEFNAAKILKMAYEVLERASSQKVLVIDANFIPSSDESTTAEQKQLRGIRDAPTKNLMQASDIDDNP